MTDQNNTLLNSSGHPLPDYPKDFLEEMGLGDLPQEKKDELALKMAEVVVKRIALETADKLSPQDREEYLGMIERNAEPEEMEKFLKEKIPDYEEMALKAVNDFKEEMKREK